MSVGGRQVIAAVALIAAPLGVTALAGLGLWQLDRMLETVSEEYAEVRMLQSIDGGLSAAALALGSSDPHLRASARGLLQDAEVALIGYLATQYHSVAPAQHQAAESGKASQILTRLQHQLTAEAEAEPFQARASAVATLRAELESLQRVADAGVQAAHRSAVHARDSTLRRVVGASIVSAALCGLLVTWSTRSVNRRLRDLHRRLAAREPGVPVRPARDLGGVVTQIEDLNSRMIQKIEEHGRELLRRERMVGIGLLAADVAHEINNPMNAMLGLSELGLRALERGPLDEPGRAELEESLRVVRREALRCKGIVERLMAMVRGDRTPGWFDATRLLRETVRVAQAARPDRAGCFVVTGENLSVLAYGPANDVRQIVLTLLINAADAIGADGRIEADATRAGQEVWLRVRDNGRGFTEEMRRTFFTPFSSFREDGTGLGLSIAQALAEGMGASLRPFSEGPGRGSMFILSLPLPKETP